MPKPICLLRKHWRWKKNGYSSNFENFVKFSKTNHGETQQVYSAITAHIYISFSFWSRNPYIQFFQAQESPSDISTRILILMNMYQSNGTPHTLQAACFVWFITRGCSPHLILPNVWFTIEVAACHTLLTDSSFCTYNVALFLGVDIFGLFGSLPEAATGHTTPHLVLLRALPKRFITKRLPQVKPRLTLFTLANFWFIDQSCGMSHPA